MTHVWYVSYGSNMSADRFARYLYGGTPVGGARCYPGCRDRTPPGGDRAVFIDGAIYFAERSLTWGGGIAFLDPHANGRVPGRAWLITVEQFADVCAQEMRFAPGAVTVPVDRVVDAGTHALGPGYYETLIHVGALEGHPMVTFTAPRPLTPRTVPSEAYVDTIVAGLVETHGWSRGEARRYLWAAAEPSSWS